MKNYILFLVFILCITSTFSQNHYIADSIPDLLRKDADAVIRLNNVHLERTSIGVLKKKVHKVITVLNKNGIESAVLHINYDKFRQIKNITGKKYNAKGLLTETLKKDQIQDFSNFPNFILFSDNRCKYYVPASSSYPFTMEYEYEIIDDGDMSLNNWEPLDDFRESVEEGHFDITFSADLPIKYKEVNFNFNFKRKQINSDINYSWSIKNYQAITEYEWTPYSYDLFPSVIITPERFLYSETYGNFESWESFGKWENEISLNRDILPENTIIYIRNLTDTIPDVIEKIKCVYKYLQSHTRYVAIELGIGGYQPMTASEVDKYGYGDCKALSNYMNSLLKSIGIQSYNSLIGSGDVNIRFRDFASDDQTNHMIINIPVDNDTIWLECTAQLMPFNYLGSSSSNRYSVAIYPDGGRVVKTPRYLPEQNKTINQIEILLSESGSIELKRSSIYENCAYDDILKYFYLSEKESKESIIKSISLSNLSISNFKIEDLSKSYAKAQLSISANSSGYATVTGNRILFKVNPFADENFELIDTVKRKYNVFSETGYSDYDSISITLPTGYEVDYKPEDTFSDCVFGKFEIKYLLENNRLIVNRFIQINDGSFGKNYFSEINEFFEKVNKSDNSKIVLKKK